MGKLLLLTLNEQEETAIDKIISAISDYIQIEPMPDHNRFRVIFSGTGNKAEPTPGISRRGGSKPYPP